MLRSLRTAALARTLCCWTKALRRDALTAKMRTWLLSSVKEFGLSASLVVTHDVDEAVAS